MDDQRLEAGQGLHEVDGDFAFFDLSILQSLSRFPQRVLLRYAFHSLKSSQIYICVHDFEL